MGGLAIQALGLFGTLLYLLSYQCKKGGRTVLVMLCGNLAYVLHYFLLEAYTGCLSIGILFLSNGLISLHRCPWARWKGWRVVICALFALSTALTWAGWISLLPFVGTTAAALFNWTRNGKVMRLGRLFLVSPLWLVYNFLIGSWSGMLDESLGMGSMLLSIWRFGIKELDKVA